MLILGHARYRCSNIAISIETKFYKIYEKLVKHTILLQIYHTHLYVVTINTGLVYMKYEKKTFSIHKPVIYLKCVKLFTLNSVLLNRSLNSMINAWKSLKYVKYWYVWVEENFPEYFTNKYWHILRNINIDACYL